MSTVSFHSLVLSQRLIRYVQSSSGGPREPWHDLHSKIEGPAAYDVLTNFEQRYRKAIKWIRIKKCKPGLDSLLKLDRIPSIHMPAAGPDGDQVVHVTKEEDPENWHVQVLDMFLLYMLCSSVILNV